MNIDVDIVGFEIEGSLHVGGADETRRGVVLPSHPPQLLAFGEGRLPLVVAAGDGAFNRHFSGHFPDVSTTAQGVRTCARGDQRQLLSW